MKCSCCGADNDIQMHHLYPKSQGCPDTLMVPLCYTCHRKAHGLKTSLNHSELVRAGLMKAKARGVKLGWSNPARNGKLDAVAKGAASTAANADTFAMSKVHLSEAKAAADKGTIIAAQVRIAQADTFAMSKVHLSEQALASAASMAVRKKNADTFAKSIGPFAVELKEQGYSLRKIAARFEEMGVKTPRGKTTWQAIQVKNLIDRTIRIKELT